MAMKWRHCFLLACTKLVPPLVASIMAKFEEILWERFGNLLEQSFKGHQTCE